MEDFGLPIVSLEKDMQDEIDQEQKQVLGASANGDDTGSAEELAPGFDSLIAAFETGKISTGSNGTRSSDIPDHPTDERDEISSAFSSLSANMGETAAELSLTKIYDQLVLGKTIRMIMPFKAYHSLRTSIARKHKSVVESLEKIGGETPLSCKYLSSSFDRTTERCEFSLQDKAQKAAVSYRIDSIL